MRALRCTRTACRTSWRCARIFVARLAAEDPVTCARCGGGIRMRCRGRSSRTAAPAPENKTRRGIPRRRPETLQTARCRSLRATSRCHPRAARSCASSGCGTPRSGSHRTTPRRRDRTRPGRRRAGASRREPPPRAMPDCSVPRRLPYSPQRAAGGGLDRAMTGFHTGSRRRS